MGGAGKSGRDGVEPGVVNVGNQAKRGGARQNGAEPGSMGKAGEVW